MLENMRYVHFAEMCRKLKNERNMRKSHVHVFLASITSNSNSSSRAALMLCDTLCGRVSAISQ